jgi:hypothetical protein
MKNRATTIFVKSTEMPTQKLAIVPKSENSADEPMPPPRHNALKEYILRVKTDENLSYQAIETRAREQGYSISRGTIQRITGDGADATDNPGVFTLVALAYGMDRTVEEILTITLGDELKNPSALQRGELAAINELAKQLLPSGQKFYKRLLQMIERELRFMLRGE